MDAITSGANVLANYGVSMTDTVAMITAANTTLQDTSRVGNGLKTIQTRLAGIKTSAKDGTLSLNKTAMALKEIAGIDVFSDESKGELKGMSEVITELGEKWADLTDKQRAGLSEAIAGANQASVFQSLMTNFEVMKKVQEELGQGMQFGSMFAENEQYIDSIAGKLNTLKEVWVGVFNTIFSSSATKSILDGLISISEAIANVITMLDETDMLTPVLMGLGAILASKAFTGLPNLFRGGTESARGFSSIIPRVAEGLGNFGLMGTRAGVALLGVEGAFASAGVATSGFLATAASFIPWAVAGAVAVGGLIWAFDHFNESLDEEKERLNESIATRKQEIASIEEQKSKLQGIQEEYDKLANKPKKTADEVERLAELTKQIAEIRPDLIVGYDDNNNPILSMTGDVQDLIEEMDRATESKKKLLSVEQDDLAKNSIKQLHGYDGGRLESEGYRPDTEMNKLEDITSQHVTKMSNLEAKRDKLLNKLYNSTGKERQQILKDLEKANYDIEKQQSEFASSYQQQLQVVQEYSSKIGEGIFSSLENSSVFKNMDSEMQKAFSGLKDSLDFTDIKTEEQLLGVEMAMNNLMKAFANGDLEIEKVSSALEKANSEFAKTGDAEKYSQSIEKIISDLEEATGKDFSALKDVFEGMDTSVLKGKDALDEFLRAYNKTRADLGKDDGFAKALANQKRQIEQAIEELNSISGDAEIDLELAYNIINNNELPMELRDMVRVLINKGYNSTEVVQFAQEILVDISDGKIDIDAANEKIKEKFGEGAFEITPEILMSESTRIAGVETVLKQIEERFGEIPPVIKTIIKAEGVTAFNDAKAIMETYNSIPEEVRTVMSTNGVETLADIVNVNNMLGMLPSDVVMNILTNFPEVVQGATSVEDIVNSLPPSVLMEINSNYPEVVQQSSLLRDAIDKIPATKESTVSVKEDIQKGSGGFLDRLFGKKDTSLTATAVINAQVNNIEALQETESIINRLTGGSFGGATGGGSKRSVEQFDFQYDVNPIEDVSPLTRGARGATGGGGGGYSISVDVNVSGQEELQKLQDLLDRFTVEDVKATISINTAQSAQNLSGLIARLNQTKTAISSIGSKNVNVNTAQAAKNLSGLLVRVREYVGSNIATKTCKVETAQGAKNISGLIRKIGQYNGTKISTKTINVNATNAINQINTLMNKIKALPTTKTINVKVAQSGSVPNMSRSVPQVQNAEIEPNKISLLSNDVDTVNTIENMSKTASKAAMRATVKTPLALDSKSINDGIKYSIELLKELDNRMKMVSDSLSILDKKMKHATGEEKIGYLKEQNSLFEEQIKLQKELEESLIKQKNEYQTYLKSKNFEFTDDGNLKNYEEKLLAMENELEKLEKIAEAKQKAQSDYKGDDEKHKDKLSKEYDVAKESADKYKDSLDEIKKYLNEYTKVAFDDLPKVKEDFIDINNAIKDNLDSIKEFEESISDLRTDSGYKNHERDIKDVENQLAMNKIKQENASYEEKNALLEEELILTKKLQKEKQELLEFEEKSRDDIMKQMAEGYGFKFRDDGSIESYGQKIEELKKVLPEDEFKKVFGMVEEYLEKTNDTIPKLEQEWEEFNNQIIETSGNVDKLKNELKDLYTDSSYKNEERDMWEVENKLDKNETEMELAQGERYAELLRERIELKKQEKKETQDMLQLEKNKRGDLMGSLGNYGFKFRDDGSIVEYGQKIEELKKTLPEEEFNKVFGLVEDYLDTTYQKIPELENEWNSLGNEIIKYNLELDKIDLENKLDKHVNKLQEINNEYDKLSDRLSIIDIKLKHASGKEKIELLEEQIRLLEEQMVKQKDMEVQYKAMMSEYQGSLNKYGFKFNADGDILNLDEILNKNKNSVEIERMKELVEEYLDIQRNKLPDAQKEWESLNSAIKDAYKEQLNVTKQVEDKILAIYKKQLEERKKLIDSELDARLKALKKEQDAYNDARNEADYNRDFEDQQKVIENLQKQIDIASKDSSLSGKKKLEELLKKMEEEQRKLQDMVQDKIDSDVNDMFDKESERLEEEAQNAKDDLDEKYSDDKLQQIVKDALTNGVFVDIDGNLKDLQETLLDFEDKFGDGMTAIGAIIKDELVANLEIAKETMKDLGSILNGLDLNSIPSTSFSLGETRFDPSAYSSNNTNSISFNSPLVVVQGNVTEDTMPQLKNMIKKAKDDIFKEIVKASK